MERLLIKSSYLKAAHYFFYSMAVLYLTLGMNFGGWFKPQSAIFIISFIIYANTSGWLAYFYYKDYSIELRTGEAVQEYAPPYLFLSIYVILTAEVSLFFIPGFYSIVYSMLFLNYYYIILLTIGGFLAAVRPLRGMFRFHGIDTLEEAKNKALKYSNLREMAEYVVGTDPRIDEILEDIYSNRGGPMRDVRRLEKKICRIKLSEVRAKISRTGLEQLEAGRLKKEEDRYKRMIKGI